jgi:hypothetical protein
MTRQRFGPSIAAETTLRRATSETYHTRLWRSRYGIGCGAGVLGIAGLTSESGRHAADEPRAGP